MVCGDARLVHPRGGVGGIVSQIFISLQQVLILVFEIGVGFVLTRLDMVKPDAMGFLSFLVVNVGLPCAIISSIAGLGASQGLWASLAGALALIVGATMVQALVATALFRMQSPERAAVYRLASVYGNSAFMGIPLVSALIGSEYVIFATLMVIVDSVALFVHAPLAMSGRTPTPGFIVSRIFGQVTVAMLIGLVLLALDIEMPLVVQTCIADFSGLVTPLAMIIVGCQLAQQRLSCVFAERRRYVVAALKLVIWPMVLVSACCFTPLSGLTSSAAIAAILICKATPQAAVLGVLAQQYHADGEEAASVVGLCTMLSAITLPVVASVVSALLAPA